MEWHTRQQYRDCVMGLGVSACSNLFINRASCIPSLSCLPFFLYHHYMPLYKFAGFLIYLFSNSFVCATGSGTEKWTLNLPSPARTHNKTAAAGTFPAWILRGGTYLEALRKPVSPPRLQIHCFFLSLLNGTVTTQIVIPLRACARLSANRWFSNGILSLKYSSTSG